MLGQGGILVTHRASADTLAGRGKGALSLSLYSFLLTPPWQGTVEVWDCHLAWLAGVFLHISWNGYCLKASFLLGCPFLDL